MFTDKDIEQLNDLGIDKQVAIEQLDYFKSGFPYLSLLAPAIVGKGIVTLSKREQDEQVKKFDEFTGTILKFVPASGAATRMFKDLYKYKESKGTLDLDDKGNKAIKEFFDRLCEFAFFGQLNQLMFEQGVDLRKIAQTNYSNVVSTLLDDKGMSYGHLPKAVLKFHKYPDEVHTAIEEHLVEAAYYACDKAREARLHFTVSPEHRGKVESLLEKVLPAYEKRFDCKFTITLSEQKKSTNTIAVDNQNRPFRCPDTTILFRPGGHGALIENLDEQKEDIIFIKNIDNVLPETKVAETVYWKKVLAGVLLSSRDKVFSYLNRLEKGEKEQSFLDEIRSYIQQTFCISLPQTQSNEELSILLYSKLHRPIRVCGMVKNEGEPGGGPYVVQEEDGTTSMQILEVQQVNMQDEKMKACFNALTHFNPVDLVCSCYDHKGVKYCLKDFIDYKTGFISEKSLGGEPLKAQELPGLWNGAMSKWSTIFVEVPLAIFNPVKTVNDLLRKEHLV